VCKDWLGRDCDVKIVATNFDHGTQRMVYRLQTSGGLDFRGGEWADEGMLGDPRSLQQQQEATPHSGLGSGPSTWPHSDRETEPGTHESKQQAAPSHESSNRPSPGTATGTGRRPEGEPRTEKSGHCRLTKVKELLKAKLSKLRHLNR
jgi:hypothetical protein